MSTRRARIPHPFGIIHTIFRVATLAISLADLVILCELAIKYSNTGPYPRSKVLPSSISASVILITTSILELIPLVDPTHTIKRVAPGLLMIPDLAAIPAGIYGLIENIFSDWDLSNAPMDTPRPWVGLQYLAFRLTAPLPAMAFVAFIFDCIGCWGKVKNTKYRDPPLPREHLLAERERAETQKE